MTSATPLGVFDGQSDIGSALLPGKASYDAATKQYTVTSAGYNIWYFRDEFQYVWKKVSGDASLAADVSFPDPQGYSDRKVVMVVRQSLEDNSKEAMIAAHGGGLVHLASRLTDGANLTDMQYRFGGSLPKNAKRIGIEKRGDAVAIYISLAGEPIQQLGPPAQIHFDGPYYIGIGFCSHTPDKLDSGVFSNVVLENAAGKVR